MRVLLADGHLAGKPEESGQIAGGDSECHAQDWVFDPAGYQVCHFSRLYVFILGLISLITDTTRIAL